MRARWLVILIVVAATLLTGIIATRPGTEQKPETDQALAARMPQRIICMAPNITETVFAVGAGDRVVGVDTYTEYPPEAKRLPRVGGLFDPSPERIVALKPDLVIVWNRHKKVEKLCERRGIRVLKVHMSSLATILEGIRRVGKELGCSARAEALCAEIEKELSAVKARIADRPKVRVLFLTGRRPGTLKNLYAVGGKSFLHEIIGLAGGENILKDLDVEYPQVSVEAVVARAPEVIIDTHLGEEMTEELERRYRADWEAVPSLASAKIVHLTDNYLLSPGPRVARIALRLAEVFRPEQEDRP